MTLADSRPPLVLSPDHTPDVSSLRYDCLWRETKKGWEPGCGPGQQITNAYQTERSHMTGASRFLIHRCAGCNTVINGSAMDVVRERAGWTWRNHQ